MKSKTSQANPELQKLIKRFVDEFKRYPSPKEIDELKRKTYDFGYR